MTIESAEIVPLIAVRNWLSELPDVAMAAAVWLDQKTFREPNPTITTNILGAEKPPPPS